MVTNFLRYLGGMFKIKLKSGEEVIDSSHAAFITALDNAMNNLDSDLDVMKLEMLLQESTGEWLEEWGEWFGVPRKENEQDEEYRNRIRAVIITPKSTIPAIEQATKAYLDDQDVPVKVYEPFTELFKLGQSKLSGGDLIQDGTYHRHNVVFVEIGAPIDQELKSILDSIRSGGVQIFFTNLGDYKSPGYGEVLDYGDLSLHTFRETSILRFIYNIAPMVMSGDGGTWSGKQIIWEYFERQFPTFVTSVGLVVTPVTQEYFMEYLLKAQFQFDVPARVVQELSMGYSAQDPTVVDPPTEHYNMYFNTFVPHPNWSLSGFAQLYPVLLDTLWDYTLEYVESNLAEFTNVNKYEPFDIDILVD